MANQRSPHRLRQGLTVSPPSSPPSRRRWMVIGGAFCALLLALAWFQGGETPLRPIVEPVQLPEQPQ